VMAWRAKKRRIVIRVKFSDGSGLKFHPRMLRHFDQASIAAKDRARSEGDRC
jgi:hypothetical protein